MSHLKSLSLLCPEYLEYIRQIVQNVTKSSCVQSAMIEDERVMDDFSVLTTHGSRW